jgi:hypothetical protein
MLYAKRVKEDVAILYCYEDIVGTINLDGAVTVHLRNVGNYMHLLPLITYVLTTAWSNYMYITPSGVVYGVDELIGE